MKASHVHNGERPKSPMRWHILFHLIKNNNFKDFVEIGTADGKTSYSLLSNIKNINVTTIDPYKFYPDYVDGKAHQPILDNLKSDAYRVLQPFIVEGRCKMIPLFSQDAAIQVEYADIIFIDANHSYEYVKKDIETYRPKIKKGGILCGHDYGACKGVTRAIDEIREKLEVNFSTDYFWYLYIKE
jgi:hypothetical protein